MKINDHKGRREVREFPTNPTILIDESVWKKEAKISVSQEPH